MKIKLALCGLVLACLWFITMQQVYYGYALYWVKAENETYRLNLDFRRAMMLKYKYKCEGDEDGR